MSENELQAPPPKIHLNAADQARDLLAQSKPGQFVATFIERLSLDGDLVLARLFTIATSEDSDTYPPGVQLKAIETILKMTKVDAIVEVAMGLKRHVGRPGDEAEREAEKQAGEWADIVELDEEPEGSGHYQAKEED